MPNVEYWLAEMARAADRLAALGALEGTAGNLSLFLPAGTDGLMDWLAETMPRSDSAVPPGSHALPAGTLLITGTGRRLRDLPHAAPAVLCAVNVRADGSAWLHRSATEDIAPTSEIDSHLAVHADHLANGAEVHAVAHAQPRNLTWLSHIPAYRDELRLNRQLMRWQPEMVVMFPDGVGILPFETPGTVQQGQMTATALHQQRLVVWAKHGVVARSAAGPQAAADLIDYAEAAASYEVLDLRSGRPADGLSLAEIRIVAERFGLSTPFIDRLPAETLV